MAGLELAPAPAFASVHVCAQACTQTRLHLE